MEWAPLYEVFVDGRYTSVIPAAFRMPEYCAEVPIGPESRSRWYDSYVDGPDAVFWEPSP